MNAKATELIELIKTATETVQSEIDYFTEVIKENSEDECDSSEQITLEAFDRVWDEAMENPQDVFDAQDVAWLKKAVISVGWAVPYDKDAQRIGSNHFFMFGAKKYEFLESLQQFFEL